MNPAAGTPDLTGRARVVDVARVAGVSTATVDRVLHGRRGVRAATVSRVARAAAELDYLTEDALQQVLQPRPRTLAFLLPAGTNRFIQLLRDYVEIAHEHLAPFNVACQCHVIEGFNPEVLARALLRHGRRADAVACIALDDVRVRKAVATLAVESIPVFTLVSDLPDSQRTAYVGLDNAAAGRTAALLLGRFLAGRRGKIGLVAGSLSYRGHEEREAGFLALMRERFPDLPVLGLREGHDDPQRNYEQTRALLAQHPDLVGLYNLGGSSDGIARALKEAGMAEKVVFIGHELTADTRAALIDGTLDAVINQNPQIEIMNCVRILANLRDGRDPLSGVEPMRVGIVLRENLP